MPKLAAFVCLVFAFAMPCPGGGETVISAVADCRLLGGYGYWSNPALWTPMQVPDNGRPPGATYEVSIPRAICPTIYLDLSVTINSFWTMDGFFASDKKPTKLRGNNVSFTVLRDARIDELNMTNVKFDIGGLLWISSNDGWILTDSKVKAQNYRHDGYTQNNYLRTAIETAAKFVVADFASAELRQSSIETQDLELSNGSLSLFEGSTVKVKGDFSQAGDYSVLRLDGRMPLSVDGNARLGGTLYAGFPDGYHPSVGEEFTILRCKGAISGNWTLYNPGGTLQLVTDDHTVSLKVVAAP